MAAANASARGQRVAIFASPLSELTGFNLTVDCSVRVVPRANICSSRLCRPSTAGADGGRRVESDAVLGGCGGRVGAAWLVTGPVLNMRVRPRRVALWGPEARESAAHLRSDRLR